MADYFAGAKRQRLIRDLADGQLTTQELAEKYEKSASWIETFAGKHREAVFAIRQDPADEISQLWISRLVDRLAELEADVEFVNDFFEQGGKINSRLLEVKHTALRHAAEALGQLSPKLFGDGVLKEIEYRIVGVDIAEIAQPSQHVVNRGFDAEPDPDQAD